MSNKIKRAFERGIEFIKYTPYRNYKKAKPFIATFAVTYNCNSKCKTCNFWKKKYENEMTIEEIKKAFNNPFFNELKEIGLTGGEAFLRNDLGEIVKYFKRKGVYTRINNNGLFPKRLKKMLSEMEVKPDAVTISLDGNKETHDYLRGIKGAYERAIESINIIKELHIKTGIRPTISRTNYNQISYLKELGNKLGVDVEFNFVHFGKEYYGEANNLETGKFSEEEIEVIERNLNKIGNHLIYKFYPYWFRNHKRRIKKCYAGYAKVHIGPQGKVYPCLFKPAFADLRKDEEIKVPEIYKNCEDCYIGCELIPNLKIDYLKWKFKKP